MHNGRVIPGLVTIDVEPDNVWGDAYSKQYKNIKMLPKYNDLCCEYGIRPTYLVCWSVAANKETAKILEAILLKNNCEIGMHTHLWEIPPYTNVDYSNKATVAFDYDELDILIEKYANLIKLITKRFGRPKSHRAGRWGIDYRQISIMYDMGVQSDSSLLPGMNWSSTGILDHTKAPLKSYYIGSKELFEVGSSGILEIPCTIRPKCNLLGIKNNNIVRVINKFGFGPHWLRAFPNVSIDKLLEVSQWGMDNIGYLNIMSHSSEFIPGQSPYWKTDDDIKYHLGIYRKLFLWWHKHNVQPKTMSEYTADYAININI